MVSSNTAALLAIKRATTTIPVVMLCQGDPVGTGLVDSLAHPGGNITGLSNISPELGGKRLELLNEVVPGLGPRGGPRELGEPSDWGRGGRDASGGPLDGPFGAGPGCPGP